MRIPSPARLYALRSGTAAMTRTGARPQNEMFRQPYRFELIIPGGSDPVGMTHIPRESETRRAALENLCCESALRCRISPAPFADALIGCSVIRLVRDLKRLSNKDFQTLLAVTDLDLTRACSRGGRIRSKPIHSESFPCGTPTLVDEHSPSS